MTVMNLTRRTKLLIGIAAGITAYVVFAQKDPQTAEAARDAAGVRKPHTTAVTARPAAYSLLQLAHRVADRTAAGALFATNSWYAAPAPPPAPPVVSTVLPVAPPAPTAPPMPFQYIGSYAPDGGAAVFFLTRGDRVYDVRVGDTLDNTYTLEGFNGSQLLITYKPLNIQQQLAAGGTQ
jgi:hypothetical protein